MIENSSANLVMLHSEVAVTVTGEEHHQAVLARYPVPPGGQRSVAVELGWCTIRSGKYRGQQAIEVHLDGRRVGELTYLMSQRYGPLVSQVLAQGGRPGCVAVIQRGERKLELVLRMPHAQGAVPAPRTGGTFAANKPVWIVVGVVAAILLIGGVASIGGKENAAPATTSGNQLRTSTSVEPPATTARPITTTIQPTTTTPPPAPPPPATTKPPVPKTTTKTQPPPPPPAEEPAEQCNPNYTPCVPIASDVDCVGGGGNGPAYVQGPVRVIGRDVYGLDRDGDRIGCE